MVYFEFVSNFQHCEFFQGGELFFRQSLDDPHPYQLRQRNNKVVLHWFERRVDCSAALGTVNCQLRTSAKFGGPSK